MSGFYQPPVKLQNDTNRSYAMMDLAVRRVGILTLAICLWPSVGKAEPPRLELPIKCQIGKNCWVSKYKDDGAATGLVKDYGCGRLADDGHKGTDFAIRDQLAMTTGGGIMVVAAAAGTVIGIRDGMNDINVRIGGIDAVKNKECGNGVLIDHGDSWQTQYCHMERGSIQVKKGQGIIAGKPLGHVGMSGAAEYPHVHFEVRKDNIPVDPFLGPHPAPDTCGVGDHPLWTKDALATMPYKPIALYNLGFATQEPTLITAGEGHSRTQTFPPDAETMFTWAVILGLVKGDAITFRITGPDGNVREKREIMDRSMLQYMAVVNAKRPSIRWTSGRYVLEVSAKRSDKTSDMTAARQEIAVP